MYPKVLVICSNPFCSERNNGMTMLNLFRGWPENRLAQIYLETATIIPPDFSVCKRYWKLTPYTALKSIFFKESPGELIGEKNVDLESNYRSLGTARRGLMALARISSAGIILEPLRELLLSSKSLVSPGMRKWIGLFGPDVIYTTLGSLHMIKLCLDVVDEIDVQIVPHFSDDWISTIYNNCLGGGILRSKLNASLQRVWARSSVRLTISDAMATEYARRYGGKYETFLNCVESSRFDSSRRHKNPGAVRLLFIGGLHLERWRSLQKIGQALKVLSSEGSNSELVIYTMPEMADRYRDLLKIEPVMRVGGWVKNENVPLLVSEADILVHVESFDPKHREYAKFSISTKIPEYLMSGRCLLAYGPADLASIKYIEDSGAGLAVGEDNSRLLLECLRRLIHDKELRERFGHQARKVAMEKHEASAQRERFRRALCNSTRE